MIGQDGLDFQEEVSFALPNEVPAQLNIQDPNLLKSRTVQSLIQQSQDLMARLTVALKRNIDLEQRLEDQKLGFDTLQAEYDVYKDHTRFFKERISQLEFDLNQVNGQKTETEKQFAELYSNIQLVEKKRKEFLKQFHRYQKYRARIKRITRPYVSRLKNQIDSLNKEVQNILNQKLRNDEMIKDLRTKLSEAIEHIQAQHKKYDQDQRQLVDYHESRYKNICEDLGRHKTKSEYLEKAMDTLQADNKKLSDRVIALNDEFSQRSQALTADYEKLRIKLKDDHDTSSREFAEKEINLQNKLIVSERRYEETKNELENKISEYNSMRFNLTSQLNSYDVNFKSSEQQNKDLKEKLTTFENENLQIRDQLANIQLLYNESISQIEDSKEKLLASDRLNRDLSQALSEQRKLNETLNQKVQDLEVDFNRRLTSMGLRFQNEIKTQNQSTKPQQTKGHGELLSRIQVLLTEIQSGYSTADKKESYQSESDFASADSDFSSADSDSTQT